jgi:hypothetical protein
MDTGSETSMDHANRWLSNCQPTHQKCKNQSQAPSHLPYRVLDVINFDPQGGIRLYETSSEPADYICLSHCWGQSRPQRITTSKSLNENKNRIPLDELEKTFQDAIMVTRKLHIRYLWIDSFCILQDDVADWQKESSLMANIYGGAVLTIAASKSGSSAGGCFSQLDPNFQEQLSIDYSGVSYPVYVRKHLATRNHDDAWHSTINRHESPLFDRAWCFQERILYSTSDEIV